MTSLHWAAGFLEGEGYFGKHTRIRPALVVEAGQVQREPLDRLRALFGGHIYSGRERRPSRDGRYLLWRLVGNGAAGVMMTLYPILSPRRRGQVASALAIWKAQGGLGSYNRRKTHCPAGHAYDKRSTRHSLTGRQCRACSRARARVRRAVEV